MSQHSGHKVKESSGRNGDRNIQRNESQDQEAMYNSHRRGGIQRNPSLTRRVSSDSPSEGTRFFQSRQSCTEHQGVSTDTRVVVEAGVRLRKL